MADAADSKSADGDIVGVQVPSSALFMNFYNSILEKMNFSSADF